MSAVTRYAVHRSTVLKSVEQSKINFHFFLTYLIDFYSFLQLNR